MHVRHSILLFCSKILESFLHLLVVVVDFVRSVELHYWKLMIS